MRGLVRSIGAMVALCISAMALAGAPAGSGVPVDTSAFTFMPSASYEFSTNSSDYVRAARSILKVLPPAVRNAVLAGTNTTDEAPYINQALLHYDALDFQGTPILLKSSINVPGRKRIFGNGSLVTTQMSSPTIPTFTTYTDGNGTTYNADLYIKDAKFSGTNTFVSFRPPNGNTGLGIGFKGENLLIDGLTPTNGVRAFDMQMTDFFSLRNSVINNVDKAFEFDALTTTATANLTSGSPTIVITSIPLNYLVVGSPITCPGYTANQSTISAGSPTGPGTYTLSANATASGSNISCTVTNTRANTQNSIENVGMTNVKQVGYFAKMDKLELVRVDAAIVGGGFLFGQFNDRVRLQQAHVEGLGSNTLSANAADVLAGTALYGDAFAIADNAQNGDIVFDEVSFLSTGTSGSGAVAGFYKGVNGNASTSNVTIRNSFFSPQVSASSGYAPIVSHGQLLWQGQWPYGQTASYNISFGDFTVDPYDDVVIDEGAFIPHAPQPLLPGVKAINLRLISGTVAIAADTDGIVQRGNLITFTGASEIYESITLPTGWYTLFVTGYPKSGGLVTASIRTDDANLSTRGRAQINNGSTYERPMRYVFFQPVAGAVRVGFRSTADATMVLGSFMLFKGFYSAPIVAKGSWDAPPVTALPTCSASYEGQIETLQASGVDGSVQACTKTTSGYAWKPLS